LSSRLSKNVKIKIYKTVILPVVLYGFETCSLTLRGEQRLRVFENTGLRRIFGPKRDEVTGGWRKLHSDELHNLYSLPSTIKMKSRRMRWAGYVAQIGTVGMHIGYWWQNQKEDQYIDGWIILKWILERGWIDLAHNRDQWRALVNMIMNLQVP
jgi:hypothetical protein